MGADQELLRAVFRFKTQRPSATQTAAFCRRLRDALGRPVDAIIHSEKGDEPDDRAAAELDGISPLERAWLSCGWSQLLDEPTGDVWTLQWFPAYGAVLQAERVGLTTVGLRVLALDGWTWTRHFLASGESVDSAIPTTDAVLSCGQIPRSALDECAAKIHAAMAAAVEITGTSRSAASASAAGVSGHQRTPQFLVATVQTVVDKVKQTGRSSRTPRGGMTDVGLHTGGAARDTCWPLVCEALRHALPKGSVLVDKVLLNFHGELLDKHIPQDDFLAWTADAFWGTIDECMEMLAAVVDRTTRLDGDGYDANGVRTKCERWRAQINAVAAQWNEAHAAKYCFSPQKKAATAFPHLKAPDQQPLNSQQSSMTTNGYSTGNSGYVLLGDEPDSAVAILVFLESIEPDEQAKTLFGVRAIEAFLYKCARALNEPIARGRLGEWEPQPLLDLMAWYRDHMVESDDAVRRVQRQSVCALLSWVVFCLAHRHCCDAFPDLQQHKIALDGHRLEVCVLDDVRSRTALLDVARYISDWNERAERDPLFDLSNPEGTLALARTMGQSLPVYRDMYLEVVSRLRLLCESQWATIATRKNNLEIVRQEIHSYSMALNQMQQQLKAAEDALRWEWQSRYPHGKPPRYFTNYHTELFNQEIYRLTDLIRQKTAFRDELLQLHEFVVSPLPQEQADALQILCLLRPPRPIDMLAELCWRAQRSVTPPTSGVVEKAETTSFWLDHVEGIVGELPCEDQAEFLSSVVGEIDVPAAFGPATIDDVPSAAAFAQSCVWFPTASNLSFLWQDQGVDPAGNTYVDPFQVGIADSKKYFTPALSAEFTTPNWLWAITYPGDNGPERGNLTYAQRSMAVNDDASDGATSAVSVLGSLRAYPTQQLRRIFASVAGDALDWSDKVVQAVVRQALYQVGAFDVQNADASFLWHQELMDDANVQQFITALSHLIDDATLSPRRWDSIPLLSELALFLNQFDTTAQPLLLALARTARRWALEIRDEWQRDDVGHTERQDLRSRECILYGYGVLCFDHDEGEVIELCELLALFHHAKLFARGDHTTEVESLASRIEWMMAQRAVALVQAFNRSPHKLEWLNRLAALVLPHNPNQKDWRHIHGGRNGSLSCCFVTVDSADGSTIVVNLFSGAVTSNGRHPTRVPPAIRSLSQYQRVFQERDFEVMYTKGVYETTIHTEHATQYRFCLERAGIEEVGPDYMLQLCTDAWREQLAAALPTRLATLYSHWCWLKKKIVLLRGVRVSDTGVYYVMQFDVNGTTRCYEVPKQDRSVPYTQLIKRLKTYPIIVNADPNVLAVLSKFEDPEFIQFLQQPTAPHALEISLPRFGLRFMKDEKGRLVSISHRGFVLADQQQLVGQMHRFQQYLLLEKPDSVAASRRLLVPEGAVRVSDDGLVVMDVSPDPAAALSFLTIDQHPRLGVFTPETVEARLQLAAIYAASDSRLPWTELQMTGGEASLEMLRGCTPSRPFSPVAEDHLVAIATRFAFRTPVLAIFVGLLLEKSRRLSFLFDEHLHSSPTVDYSDALDEYRNQQGSLVTTRQLPYRQRLTRHELCDLFGSATAAELVHTQTCCRSTSTLAVDELAVGHEEFVKDCEHAIESICTQSPVTHDAVPPFPLSPHGSNTMSTRMLQDVQESWATYHRHNHHGNTRIFSKSGHASARQVLASVQAKRRHMMEKLEATISSHNNERDRLARTVGRTFALTMRFVMRAVVDPDVLLEIVPSLSEADRIKWKQVCLRLLELCVLEDTLERIALGQYDLEDLQHGVKREWSTSEYPYWLVFEVENRLQIRHEQYVIAKHLLDHPGSICQLNMGRGKTRVILPMLFLHYSYAGRFNNGKLVRAHFLSPLLSETRELMWKVLTSSVLTLPFLELPYNRSCSLTLGDVAMIRYVLKEAKRTGAILIVAPEHRLSLELERVELQHRNIDDDTVGIAEALDEILNPDEFIDIFDESDALLHHEYHLVYAVGASRALDGGATRWLMAEALLRTLMSGDSKRVQQVLEQYPDAWSLQPEYQARSEGASCTLGLFNGFRLHAVAATTDEAMRAAWRTALVQDLIERPPFELEWLRLFASNADGVRTSLVQLLTDASVDAIDAMRLMPPTIHHVQHHVLALRGLLAFNVFETCLQKRYRVEYGHPPAGTRRKAIAIPFQAADLPAERSEFSHPDVGIVLTLLAFYHSGLSASHVRRAFEVLLSLDESESLRYYDEWFASVAPNIVDSEAREMLSSLKYISVDNAHQFALVFRTYRFATEVVNFYVNFCVFPRDTRQFPHRLSRSAWDLARGQRNVGFSGTNDTHYLLPHGVRQREPDEPALRGTNGKMVQLLLDATLGYEALSGGNDAASVALASWQSLLLLALDKLSHALIDTGALLAGVSNHEAAEFLVAQPTFGFQGVTYYDTRPQFDAWVVLEKDRDLIHHHKNASLRESDTFVIFDEARARGSDMKLAEHAVAVLTLGPSITKDKLMQGAGRMRLLGAQQQTLWLTSTRDVYKSIASQGNKAMDVAAVLNWVMDNTQRQCTLGLLEWAQSGIQFYSKKADAEHELQNDDWTLEGQYGGAQTQELIAEIIDSKLAKQSDVLEGCRAETEQIRRHGHTFGRQDTVFVTDFDEECEREVQIEEEQQETRARARHDAVPCVEQAWDWSLLLHTASVDSLGAHRELAVEFISLEDAARRWFVPPACTEIAWATTKIYGSSNFWSTVQVQEECAESTSPFVWTSCLREVHAMVVFADGSILLLSEFEENAVLEMLHTAAEREGINASHVENGWMARGCFALVHLPFAVDAVHRMDALSTSSLRISIRDIPLATGWNNGRAVVAERLVLPFVALVACCLLNGDTELFVGRHAAAAESALATLFARVRHREETLEGFIALRGFTGRWKRSSLHAIARRMDLEDVVKSTANRKAKKGRLMATF